MKMKKKMLALSAAALLTTGGIANAADGVYLGASLLGLQMDYDRYVDNDAQDESVLGGINLGYRFSNDWSVELNASTEIAGHEMDVAQLNFYYYFGDEDGSWRPYALAGISYFDQEDSFNELVSDQEETHQVQLGVGLAKMLNDQWEFKSDIRMYQKVREGFDGINDIGLNLAVNYYFDSPAPVAAPVAEPARIAEPVRVAEPAMRTITIRLNVEFETDSDKVRGIYGDELSAVARAMQAHDDITLVLEGHTDSRASDTHNQDLSERRAAAVKARLVDEYQIPSGRISSVGYGESRPIADNDTVEGRTLNRRVIGEMSYKEVLPE